MESLTPPSGVWPTTVAGWFALATSIAGMGYVLYDKLVARVKHLEEVNGLGRRVDVVEDWQKHFDAGATERALIQQNVLRTQQDLLTQLGEAQASAKQCQADTERMTKELKALIEAKHRESDHWERRIAVQLSNLEVELRARNILAPQPPSSPPLPRPFPREE